MMPCMQIPQRVAEYRAQAAQFQADKGPELFGLLMARIAGGEQLALVCKDLGYPFGEVLTWITVDPEMNKAYVGALETRRQQMTDSVLGELRRLAAADISLAFNEDGSPKALHEIPEDVRRCISAVEVEEMFEGKGEARVQVGLLHKFKLWDKGAALERLGKHLKLFTDKLEVDAAPELAEALAKARARLKDQDHA